MRGYLSFVLVFICSAILLSSYSLSGVPSIDLSKAISVEQASGLMLNVKEASIESIRQGSVEGFKAYDDSHDLPRCLNCPGACGPSPLAPCDPIRCGGCFREDEARSWALAGASSRLALLREHGFDDPFSVSIGPADIEIFLVPDPLSKNGFISGHTRLRSGLIISIESDNLGISAQGELPKGLVAG
jgi:hypothetical protein